MTRAATLPPPAPEAMPTLPAPIRRTLRGVDRRLRVSATARGMGESLLAAAFGAAVGMAADFAFVLPLAVRWGIWGWWVGSVGIILAAFVGLPLLRRSRWIDLAAVAERADPGLGERLTGSIALLDRQGRPNGSPALVAALAADAAAHVGAFRPGKGLVGKPATARLAAGLAALALVAAPGLARPDPFGTLALRFLAPWLDLGRVGRFAIAVEPGDQVAAIGSDFRVGATVAPRYGPDPAPDGAWLEWSDGSGAPRRARMASLPVDSGPSRKFEATLPALAGPITYRVATDSARSRSFRVTAVEPPTVASLTARVEPPSYTKLPAGLARDPARVEAVEGSRIVLTIGTSVPVGAVDLAWPSPPPAGPLTIALTPAGDGRTSAATVGAEASGPFTLTPRRDRHGIDGRPDLRQVVVRPDAPPTLAVRGPAAPGESGPDDVLEVAVAARDDFAVASAELHYEVRRKAAGAAPSPDADRPGHVDLPLAGLGTPTARGDGSLPLRQLDLRPGDSVTYRVRVLDNRPAPRGPNETWSSPRPLAIVATTEPMLARRDRARRESIQARLEEIRKANAANRREVEQLRYAADAAGRDASTWGPDRDAALAAREAEARAVVDRLQLLARDVEADPTFAPLARPARQAADVEGESARAQLDKARRAEPARRLAEIRQADGRLGAFGNRLDELARRLEALAKLDLDRQKLRDLAAREDELADKAGRPDADPGRLGADQDEVRRKLDDLVNKSPGLRAGVLAAQAEEAARLAREARELADRQRLEARKTAESARADGPNRELAAAQRALEDDARRLALDVDEPLAENGRGRVDTEAVRRGAEPIERGDLPDAVRRMEEAEDGLRRLARDIEDVPGDPKALARRLARRQEILANDANAAVGPEARKPDPPPDARAALAARIAPLAARQGAIAGLAARVVAPEAQKGAAAEAVRATDRAAEVLRAPRPRESEEAQNQAKRALNQFADALPDPNRARDEARRKLDEAKRKQEEVARDIDRALAETQPRPDKPGDDLRAAADLGERLAPLVARQREAAALLARLDVDGRARPHRDRAAHRADRLARQIQAVKDQAPPRQAETRPKPPAAGWHVAGPFPVPRPPIPFDPAKAVDLGGTIDVTDGQPARPWKLAPASGDEGIVNLGQIYSRADNQSAFAVAEVTSPSRRKAQLSIGSDDTLVVWLNGRQVFEYGGSRSCSPGQDKVDVELVEGVNRLAVRCGNGNGDWMFAVGITPPPPDGFDPEKARRLRDTLAATKADALAAAHRLDQKSQGKMPADDLAAELAAEQTAAAAEAAQAAARPPGDDPTPRERAAADRRRVATALRNLVAPDAPAPQAEAVRQADAAARLAADADPKAIEAAARAAAEAGDALARRLADGPDPAAPPPAAVADAGEAAGAAPADPELGLGPEPAARAADLARRQRRLRERLQAAMGERVAPQQDLRRDSSALAREMADLRDRAREVNARGQGQANNAADLLGQHAPRAMDQGAEQMAQGRVDQARDQQRQAADFLERAAREAEDLAAGLRAEGAAEAGGTFEAAGLGEARATLRQLAGQFARSRDAQAAQAAAPAMRRAADSLRAAARPAPGPGAPPSPGLEAVPDNPDPVAGAPTGAAAPDLAALQDLVRKKTGRQWGELPGHLRTEILQLSQGKYRDDYARLIQLYFREIAADAARPAKP